MGKNWFFEPALFYNDISNLIALSALVDFQRHYINVNNHKTHGGTMDVTYKPVPHFSGNSWGGNHWQVQFIFR